MLIDGVVVADVVVGLSGVVFVVTFESESVNCYTLTFIRPPLCVPLLCAVAVS